jgi:hypothetical protein
VVLSAGWIGGVLAARLERLLVSGIIREKEADHSVDGAEFWAGSVKMVGGIDDDSQNTELPGDVPRSAGREFCAA